MDKSYSSLAKHTYGYFESVTISFAPLRYEYNQTEGYLDLIPIVSFKISPQLVGCSHWPIHGRVLSEYCVPSHPFGFLEALLGEKRHLHKNNDDI